MPFGWAALAGGVASVAGSAISAGASSDAADKQLQASQQANQFAQQQFAQTQANLSPYMQLGTGAGSKLSSMLGIGGDPNSAGYGSLAQGFTQQDFNQYKDPGYNFQLQQGQQALQNSQAAGDGVLSGGAMKGLINYNQGMANTAYTNAYDRWNSTNTNTYNRLGGLLQVGQNSAAGVGAQGASLSNTVSNNLNAGANASSAGTVGAANAISGGLNSAGGYYALSGLGKTGSMNSYNNLTTNGEYGNLVNGTAGNYVGGQNDPYATGPNGG